RMASNTSLALEPSRRYIRRRPLGSKAPLRNWNRFHTSNCHRPMIESATGLILRTRPLTETSLIIHWLTPDLGRIATVAKGARRPKSPFRGKLDLFYLADFSFSRSRRSELHNLREVNLRELHR